MHLIVSYALSFMLMIETSVIGRVISQSGDQICECKIGLENCGFVHIIPEAVNSLL